MRRLSLGLVPLILLAQVLPFSIRSCLMDCCEAGVDLAGQHACMQPDATAGRAVTLATAADEGCTACCAPEATRSDDQSAAESTGGPDSCCVEVDARQELAPQTSQAMPDGELAAAVLPPALRSCWQSCADRPALHGRPLLEPDRPPPGLVELGYTRLLL